jgi:hypothetical protein
MIAIQDGVLPTRNYQKHNYKRRCKRRMRKMRPRGRNDLTHYQWL